MNRAKYIEIRKSLSKQHTFLRAGFIQVLVTFFVASLAILPWLNPSIHTFLKLISPLLLTIAMYRSFALFHDGTHNSLSKNRIINDFLSILVSPLCLLPFDAWKKSHLLHHQWSGNVEKDPVMAFIKTHPKLSLRFQKFLDFGWKYWIPVLAFIQHIVFWSLATKVTLSEKLSPKSVFSLIYPIVFWSTVIFFASSNLLGGLVAPTLFLYLLGTEVINLPHHLQLDYRYDNSKLAPWDQFKTARSCVYPNWVSNFVVLNFNFHIEHHMYPDLPWYQLRDIHKTISSELGIEYTSESSFSWILTSRKLTMSEVLAPAKKQVRIAQAV